MTASSFKDIKKLDSDVWEADNLRAKLQIHLQRLFHAGAGRDLPPPRRQRFEAARKQIEADQGSGKLPKRKVLPADYIARRSLYLPEKARYDWIMRRPP